MSAAHTRPLFLFSAILLPRIFSGGFWERIVNVGAAKRVLQLWLHLKWNHRCLLLLSRARSPHRAPAPLKVSPLTFHVSHSFTVAIFLRCTTTCPSLLLLLKTLVSFFPGWLGSTPSDCSYKTSPGSSPAHSARNRPTSQIPKIQISLPPKPTGSRSANRHRHSMGKPISVKEIRSCSAGNAPVKDIQASF